MAGAESDLASYELQLQQVEAALSTDPDNGELTKLKTDLEQVIELTRDLIDAQSAETKTEAADEEEEDEDEPEKKPVPVFLDTQQPVKHWQVGEQCRAIWPKDGNYYEAVINEISTDGAVSVTFHRYGNQTYTTTLGSLKLSSLGYTGSSSRANKKEELAKQREYLKKKKAKKAERFKQMEKEREDEKTKWKSFANKAFGKKGFVKKSIFKTPENARGRVGIGTCGVSGQKMTEYSSASKHRRGT